MIRTVNAPGVKQTLICSTPIRRPAPKPADWAAVLQNLAAAATILGFVMSLKRD